MMEVLLSMSTLYNEISYSAFRWRRSLPIAVLFAIRRDWCHAPHGHADIKRNQNKSQRQWPPCTQVLTDLVRPKTPTTPGLQKELTLANKRAEHDSVHVASSSRSRDCKNNVTEKDWFQQRLHRRTPRGSQSTGKLYVFLHDCDALGVNGTQVRVVEEVDEEGLCCFLQGSNGLGLPPVGAVFARDILRNLPYLCAC